MPDMLVRLYDMPEDFDDSPLKKDGVAIKRALVLDRDTILDYVRSNFNDSWVCECEYALFNDPISCYIAVKDKTIIGFACYDTTAKGVFGPMGVTEAFRGKGIGEALLRSCLNSMREKGYAYTVIAWVTDAIPFYKKTVNAEVIEGSSVMNSIYKNLISSE